jgi:hypothetical protein
MPAIVPAIGLAISAYSAYKNSKAAGKAGKAQEGLLNEQAASARQGREIGTGLVKQGMPATSSALSYYSKLLQGNRAMMSQATAGANRQITDVYRGAERGLERQGVRGGERQTALAELNRDRAASIAGLTTGQQGGAASALADIGGQMTSQGISGISGAASQFGSGANAYGQNARYYGGQAQADMAGVGRSAGELGKVGYDWWKNRGAGGGGTTGNGGWPS